MDKRHVKPPEGLEILASPASWKVLDATDPFAGHAGWTAEMKKAWPGGGDGITVTVCITVVLRYYGYYGDSLLFPLFLQAETKSYSASAFRNPNLNAPTVPDPCSASTPSQLPESPSASLDPSARLRLILRHGFADRPGSAAGTAQQDHGCKNAASDRRNHPEGRSAAEQSRERLDGGGLMRLSIAAPTRFWLSFRQRPARSVPDRENLDCISLNAIKEAIREVDESDDANAGSLFDFGRAERKIDDAPPDRCQSRFEWRALRGPVKSVVVFYRFEVVERARRPSKDHSRWKFART
jgi:hypothetical protein